MGKRNGNSQASVSKAMPGWFSQTIITTRFTCRLLLYLTQRHPILFWTSSWLLMVLISWISLKGILQIDTSPLQAEQPQAEVALQTPAPLQYSAQESASSFGMLAAVVVCCGATTMLLARQLRPIKPSPRQGKSVSRFQGKSASRLAQSATPQEPQVKRSAPTASRSHAPGVAASVTAPGAAPMQVVQGSSRNVSKAPKTTAKSKTAVSTRRAPATLRQPQVEVIPYYEDHPLDWTEPGLAEMMDIRNRDSMSPYL